MSDTILCNSGKTQNRLNEMQAIKVMVKLNEGSMFLKRMFMKFSGRRQRGSPKRIYSIWMQ